MAGIYIHIPFCRSRCAYCDFFSTTREAEMGTYVDVLCREIVSRRHELPHARISTIYIGGGTPSLLSAAQLRQILDTVYANYDVDGDAEVTMEMNPDDVAPSQPPPRGRGYVPVSPSSAWLSSPLGEAERGYVPVSPSSAWFSSPLGEVGRGNVPVSPSSAWFSSPLGEAGRGPRVSLGIQTFDDTLLRLIRRRHDSATAIRAVKILQAAGCNNISIDLIYGLPGQTLAQWEHDLDTAFSLGIQHLSAYALSYEDGTPLTRWRDEGRIHEVPDELSVQMYERLCQRAQEAGFEHYEISNFALPGYHSRHNSSYWTGEPYLGFGPGAHSYDGLATRRANHPDLDAYIGSACRDGIATIESLTPSDLYDEAVMCGLRTARGIDLDAIRRRFGQPPLDYLLRMATPHLRAGRLIEKKGHLCLTRQALMVSDDVMSDLMADEDLFQKET